MKRKTKQAYQTLIFASVLLVLAPAIAYDLPTPDAKVNFVEVTYQPDAIVFKIDQLVADCAAGTLLVWEGGAAYPRGTAVTEADRKSNIKLVTNMLLVAMHTGGRVRVHARNKTALT